MTAAASRWGPLALALLLASVTVPARPAPQQPAAAAQRPPRPLHVEVNLVGIVASVLDSRGRPVTDLPKDAFEVYEEGARQRIDRFEAQTNQPLDLALMIDASLSTIKELRFEREAAAGFIQQLVRPGDGLAVFAFADAVIQLADFSADVPALQAGVQRIEPGAGTALYDAIFLGAGALERRPLERRRVIVLVTDAGETTSRSDFDSARRAALRAGAMLYTVLIRPIKSESGRNTAGEHALETITDVTGGAVYYLDSLEQLETTFDRINRELRTQYLLGYYPDPRPPAGAFRKIEVRIAAGAAAEGRGPYFVRHRKGYFTAGSPD
jgi:Ca-activated chloride channel family protein